MKLPRIHLVRHGEAASNWADAADPGLSPRGEQQAQLAAHQLASRGPLAMYSSPLRRARETALPLERLWSASAQIAPAVGEVPSTGIALADRSAWLKQLTQSRWSDVESDLQSWRNDVIRFLLSIESDAVVFSHFIVINAIAGAALGRGEVLIFQPANASVTVIEHDGDTLRLVEQGAQGASIIR